MSTPSATSLSYDDPYWCWTRALGIPKCWSLPKFFFHMSFASPSNRHVAACRTHKLVCICLHIQIFCICVWVCMRMCRFLCMFMNVYHVRMCMSIFEVSPNMGMCLCECGGRAQAANVVPRRPAYRAASPTRHRVCRVRTTR